MKLHFPSRFQLIDEFTLDATTVHDHTLLSERIYQAAKYRFLSVR